MRRVFTSAMRLGTCTLAAATAATGGALATPPVTTVAVTGQSAPGMPAGVVYATLASEPTVNAAGNVAFLGTVSGTGITAANNTGIWAGNPGAVSLAARNGDPAPGIGAGVVYGTLGPPVLSATGLQIAFESLLGGTGITTAIDETVWIGPLGSPALVAREGSAAPGVPAGVVFGSLTNVLAVGGPGSSPQVAFSAFLTGTGVTTANNLGVWAGPPASLTLAARTASAAPGTGAGVIFAAVGDAVVAAGGKLGFSGALTGTGVTTANNAGIWAGTAAAPALALRLGTAAPGAGAGVNFAYLGNPVENDGGTLAFTGTLTGTGVIAANNVGIWAGLPGSIGLVARAGSAAPGAGAGVTFGASFSSPVINTTGKIAFISTLAGTGVNTTNDTALWVGTAGSLTIVAREGSAAAGTPAGVTWRGMTIDPVINANGQVAIMCFVGGAGVTFANDFGLWVTDLAGVPQLVVREGDAIPVAPAGTRTISGITMLTGAGGEEGRRSAFNDLGHVAFRATFTDLSTGLFVAQAPTPCRADVDGNGQIQPADVATFISNWSASLSGGTLAGDFDRNGVVEPADVASFVTAWFAALSGGC